MDKSFQIKRKKVKNRERKRVREEVEHQFKREKVSLFLLERERDRVERVLDRQSIGFNCVYGADLSKA